jgi:hypothetical protein
MTGSEYQTDHCERMVVCRGCGRHRKSILTVSCSVRDLGVGLRILIVSIPMKTYATEISNMLKGLTD